MLVLCPICQSDTVAAPAWSFSDTSVEVPTCGCSPVVSVRIKTSALIGLEVPAETLRHKDGLVTLGR